MKINYVHYHFSEIFRQNDTPYFNEEYLRNSKIRKAIKNLQNGILDINMVRRSTLAYTIKDDKIYFAVASQDFSGRDNFVKATGRKLARERLYKNFYSKNKDNSFSFEEFKQIGFPDKVISAVAFSIKKRE